MAASKAMGHQTGPVSRPTWAAFAIEGRAASAKTEEAWDKYLEELDRENWRAMDRRLRATLVEMIQVYEDMVGRFPPAVIRPSAGDASGDAVGAPGL